MNAFVSENPTSFQSPDWYLLIDGAQMSEEHLDALRATEAQDFLSKLQEFRHLEGASPWVLKVGDIAHLSKALDTWWTVNPEACSWLYYAGGTTALVQHLRHQIKAQVEDGRVLTLRFWDARVFLALQHAELESIQHRVVSGVSHWFVAPQSVLSVSTSNNPSSTHAQPHAISTLQQDRLAQLLLPYAVLGELKERMPEMLSLFTREEQYTTSSALIAAAQSDGLEALSDLVAFASLGFDFHPEFYQHPDVASKLKELRQGKTLEDVVNDIRPDVWDALSKNYPKPKRALEI